MNQYIIAAGGTGAMCVRAFILLAAAGCATSDDTYHILLVDKDKESDAVTACENLLGDYNAMYDQLGSSDFKFPQMILHKWNFTDQIVDEYRRQTGNVAEDLSTLTLNKLLNPNMDAHITRLLHTMYTEEELNIDLKNGFYGHPNIGAPVFDYIRQRFLDEKINDFMSELHNDLDKGKTFVYLFGSIFGGTGATIIPGVVWALRSIVSKDGRPLGQSRLVLGSSMVMPYFKLPKIMPDSLDKIEKLTPEDTKFANQTREALDYYETSLLLREMMNLTLVGSSNLDITSEIFARGGVQTQHFHMVLMLAAVAATRFFKQELGGMKETLKNIDNDTPITPLGEIILWKFSSEAVNQDYKTLTYTELGLTEEYRRLMGFLRFCVVVAFHMRQKFDKPWNELRDDVEVQGTAYQMDKKLNLGNLSQTEIENYYKLPVRKAGDICRNYIQFIFDVALSGYDWSKFYKYEPDTNKAKRIGENTYYPYVRNWEVNKDAKSGFSSRWVDFGNLEALMELLLASDLEDVTRKLTLNDICSFELLDSDRKSFAVETDYPGNIGTIYLETLHELKLERNIFGHMKKTDVKFSDIYARLRQKCQKGGMV